MVYGFGFGVVDLGSSPTIVCVCDVGFALWGGGPGTAKMDFRRTYLDLLPTSAFLHSTFPQKSFLISSERFPRTPNPPSPNLKRRN